LVTEAEPPALDEQVLVEVFGVVEVELKSRAADNRPAESLGVVNVP